MKTFDEFYEMVLEDVVRNLPAYPRDRVEKWIKGEKESIKGSYDWAVKRFNEGFENAFVNGASTEASNQILLFE